MTVADLWVPPGADPTAVEIVTDPTVARMAGTAVHGDTPFDVPFVSEIAPNLWQGGCEKGPVLPEQIVHLVNLAPWWSYEVRHEIRSWHSFVMFDAAGIVSPLAVVAGRLAAELRKDGPTLVHCQAGLNRSSLVVALALMIDGLDADDAIALIRERRSDACLCNPSFDEWLRADAHMEIA